MSKRASLDKREKETPKVIKGVMSAFVSSSSANDDEDNKDNVKNETEKAQEKLQESEQKSKPKSNTKNTKKVKDNETIVDTNNNAESVTDNVTDNDTNIDSENVSDNETNKVTNDVTKIITNKAPKITHVKSIKIGNKTLESTYSSDELATRCAYHLRQDTIDKIEVCSKLSGMKKAEFVDLVLNSVLTEILNKGNKK